MMLREMAEKLIRTDIEVNGKVANRKYNIVHEGERYEVRVSERDGKATFEVVRPAVIMTTGSIELPQSEPSEKVRPAVLVPSEKGLEKVRRMVNDGTDE